MIRNALRSASRQARSYATGPTPNASNMPLYLGLAGVVSSDTTKLTTGWFGGICLPSAHGWPCGPCYPCFTCCLCCSAGQCSVQVSDVAAVLTIGMSGGLSNSPRLSRTITTRKFTTSRLRMTRSAEAKSPLVCWSELLKVKDRCLMTRASLWSARTRPYRLLMRRARSG